MEKAMDKATACSNARCTAGSAKAVASTPTSTCETTSTKEPTGRSLPSVGPAIIGAIVGKVTATAREVGDGFGVGTIM
jgi:hypothetical protein